MSCTVNDADNKNHYNTNIRDSKICNPKNADICNSDIYNTDIRDPDNRTYNPDIRTYDIRDPDNRDLNIRDPDMNSYPNPILGYNEYSIGLHFDNGYNNNDNNHDNDGINDNYNNNYDNYNDHNVHNDNNVHDDNYNNDNGDKNGQNQNNINNDLKNETNGIEICYSENTFYDPNYDHNNYNTQSMIQNETTIDIIDKIAKGLLCLETINFPLEDSNFSSTLPLSIPSKPQLNNLSPPSKPQLNNLSPPSKPQLNSLSPPSKPQLNNLLSPPSKPQLNDNKTTNSNSSNDNETGKVRCHSGDNLLSLSPTKITATNGVIISTNTSSNPLDLKCNSFPNPNLNANSSSIYSDTSNSAKPQVDSTTITKPLVPLFISPSKLPKNNKNNDDNKYNDKNEVNGNSVSTAIPSNVSASLSRADVFTPGTDPVTPGTTAGALPYSLPSHLSFQHSKDANNNIELTASTINPLLSTSISSTQNNEMTANTNDNINNETRSSTSDILPTHISPAKAFNIHNPDTGTNMFSPISNRYSMMALDFPANSLIMYGGGYVIFNCMYIYIFVCMNVYYQHLYIFIYLHSCLCIYMSFNIHVYLYHSLGVDLYVTMI
jgi:hypothetical protein